MNKINSKNRENNKKVKIRLGFPFDHLMNQSCQLLPIQQEGDDIPEKERDEIPALIVPADDDPGTGNIIIKGPPAAGKSTLALQLAVTAAVKLGNCAVTAYVSLENTHHEVLTKAGQYGWRQYMKVMQHLHSVDQLESPQHYANFLRSILTQPQNCPFLDKTMTQCPENHNTQNDLIDACVLLPSLSPRYIQNEGNDDIFWKRYRQLEFLLEAGSVLKGSTSFKSANIESRFVNENGLPINSNGTIIEPWELNCQLFPLVVIDSLNMFSDNPLTREQLYQLFYLFKRYKTIGIFVVESSLANLVPYDSTITDIEISLSIEEDNNYKMKYFSIDKSRYTKHVEGKHPMKTFSYPHEASDPSTDTNTRNSTGSQPEESRKVPHIYQGSNNILAHVSNGLVIYPSLHYIVQQTEKKIYDKPDPLNDTGWTWGMKTFSQLIIRKNLNRGSVVVIEGDRGAFKSNIGMCYLMDGLHRGETGLLIRLHKSRMLEGPDSLILSEELYQERFPEIAANNHEWQNIVTRSKALITKWNFISEEKNIDSSLIEIDFGNGALLPEELINVIRAIIIRFPEGKKVKRVILDDVSEIGGAYPFLKKSKTSGEIFIPAFAQIMRNHGINTVIIGTRSEFESGNDMVNRAVSIADAVIKCRFIDVFGKKHIIVQGDGMRSDQHEDIETTPAVIQIHDINPDNAPEDSQQKPTIAQEVFSLDKQDSKHFFTLNTEYLNGLVGFSSNTIHRPEIAAFLFKENDNHARYNQRLSTIMKSVFGKSRISNDPIRSLKQADNLFEHIIPNVNLVEFGPRDSGIQHESLSILQKNAPLENTVLCSVDEFYVGENEKASHFIKYKYATSNQATDNEHNENTIFLNHKDLNDYDQKIIRRGLYPYYKNVLMIAHTLNLESNNFLSWETMLNLLDDRNIVIRVDPVAPETLSCLLLDVVKACKNLEKMNEKILREKISEHDKEFFCFCRVMERIGYIDNITNPQPYTQHEIKTDIYIYWYSQLRDIISKTPELSRKLKVCPLPGKGCKGDWHIGVLNGSVSKDLGLAILKTLLSDEEDYIRFADGIGLPVGSMFYDDKNNYYAWHLGKKVKVNQIKEIYDPAWTRMDITNYNKVKAIIYNIAKQVINCKGMTDKDIIDLYNRMPNQVEAMLT